MRPNPLSKRIVGALALQPMTVRELTVVLCSHEHSVRESLARLASHCVISCTSARPRVWRKTWRGR